MNPHVPLPHRQLQACHARAVRRLRWDRVRQVLGSGLKVLCVLAVLWALVGIWLPAWTLHVPLVLGLAAGLLFLAADVAYFWPVSEATAWAQLDERLGLKDAALSAQAFATEEPEVWRSRHIAHTVRALQEAAWAKLWPARWPRFTGWAAVALALAAAALILHYGNAVAAARPAVSPFHQEQLTGIEQVFQQWEEAQQETKDPELRRLLEELKPLREKMAKGELGEKETMLELSRLEEKLQAARQKAEEGTLAAAAPELASALEGLQNMSGLAAALRRQDFAQAEKLAGEQADRLSQPGAKMPQGAESAANQQRLSKLAQTAGERGQTALRQSLEQLAQGMKKNDSQSMCQGLAGLKQCLGGECKRQGESKRLSTQLSQLSQCKECLGNGQSICKGMSLMPQLSFMKKPGGKGAGSSTELQREGAETQLASARTQEKLTGTLSGDGESETTTLPNESPEQREAPTGARPAAYKQYEQLSREAIADENIPLAHRQAIRRYFELIRPAAK